jgi:hypothetical protein
VGGRYDRVGAKSNGLGIKWRRSRQSGVGEDKKGCVEGRGWEEMGVYLRFGEKYTLGFSRARGTTKCIFFFISNRVIGF